MRSSKLLEWRSSTIYLVLLFLGIFNSIDHVAFCQEEKWSLRSYSTSTLYAKESEKEIDKPLYVEKESAVEKKIESDQDSKTVDTDALRFQTYRLAPGDSIFVYVSPRSEQLSVERKVDIEGNISLPLLGIVSVENLSLGEVTQRLTQEFSEYVVKPVIRVTLTQQRVAKVTVIGEVVRPGFYRLDTPELIDVLKEAGGITEVANIRKVQISRYQHTKNSATQSFDLYSALKSGSQTSFPRLVDGDVVVVPALDKNDPLEDNYSSSLIASSNIARPEIKIRVLNYSGNITQLSLPNGSDFLDAIAALGPDPSKAKLKDIALVRFDPVSQSAVSKRLNAKAALAGNSSQNPPLANNDVIVIGRTTIAKLNYALGLVTQPFKDVLSFILFFDGFGSGVGKVFGGE